MSMTQGNGQFVERELVSQEQSNQMYGNKPSVTRDASNKRLGAVTAKTSKRTKKQHKISPGGRTAVLNSAY